VIDNLLMAADVRWFDYRTTQLLGEPVVNGGANWDSVWAAALGARYQLSDELSVQLGYLYNQNPVPENLALFNTQLPALTEHTISAGAYYQMNESIGLALAYVHGFKNTITGSIFPLLGTSTTLDSEYDSIVFGLHIRFGGAAASAAPVAASACPARSTGAPECAALSAPGSGMLMTAGTP
jgi:long-chain fatty acid transport protein